MSAAPTFSLVLPCRNQADHIGPTLLRYLAPLEALEESFELIVVPNASTDGTAEAVAEAAQRDPRIRVVPNPRGGWGLSVRTGLAAATGAVLAYTNTARTDPASLPAFLRLHQERAPCLVKARRQRRQAPLREMGSTLYNLEGRLLFGLRTHDANGTPKVLARDLYHSLPLTQDGDLLDLEIMAWAARLRVPVMEVPVHGFQRHGGRSSTTLASAWKMYTGALRMRASWPRPLQEVG